MHILPLLSATDGAVVAGLTVMSVFWIVALILSVFWIWMLIDCLMSSLPSMEKLIWFLVILFLHVLGAALYFFIGRSGGRSRMV